MTSPVHGEALRTHAEVHGLRFQQFRFNQPQPGAVCLPPAGTAKASIFVTLRP
ncbi:hypothetical protein ECP03052938_5197 [Escherichia coli p0305293.8]|nr:hypothetical protein ECP03052938_5197 [Escherichia coli p0305293.8]